MRTDKLISLGLAALAFTALSGLALITAFIFKEGFPLMMKVGLTDFITSSDWYPREGHFGILPMIAGSLAVTAGAMVIGVVFGVGVAVLLTQFCPPRLVGLLKPAIELLAGIPSVVYGFMGVVILAPLIRENLGGSG
ncbi:MAG TPA: phosphate ABC transporter permease subunit PstC, partial [Planctomycetota bacterium]|nr:phosphate ABC transporter permease subunit PstC [Planctomycetota bacterium]